MSKPRTTSSPLKDTTASPKTKARSVKYDNPARSRLLDRAKEGIRRGERPLEVNPLVEIGDRQTQEWLSEVAMRMQIDDPLRDWMREQARRIDLQSSVDQLIEYLRSDAHEIDRTWIVRQAVRHGVAHAVIADAVVHFLDHNLEIVPEHVSASLLQSCEDLGIFAESGSGLPTRVRTAREKFTRFREDSKFLPWATAPAEARAEFYRPKQNQTNKPAKPDTDNEGDDK